MTSILKLVSSIDTNSKEFESLAQDLFNNDVPFDSHDVNAVQTCFIKSINSRINRSADFLPILEKILPTCSKDTLSKYGLFWIISTTKVLENVYSRAKDLILACKVLAALLESCKEIPELHREISMQHVKQIINNLNIANLALQENEKREAVFCLVAILLYHYPEVCEKLQEPIRKMIFLQIDSKREHLVNASARCYLLLVKATERSFKPPPSKSIYTALTYNEALLCNSLHAMMDELFSGLIELESVDIWGQLELPYIFSEKDVIHYYNRQKQRFMNLCTHLSIMLLCGYGARNSVLPHDILRVLCRGLAVTPLSLKDKTSFKEHMLYIILPKLHISLFTVLDAFIKGFTKQLVPYGSTILQLIQQTLQWTSVTSEDEMTFSNSKPFKSVRICAYKCLTSWLIHMNSLSGIETIANECATLILKDITPERDCLSLSVEPKPHLSNKRAIKRFTRSQYENSTILSNKESSSTKGALNADLCKEALTVLMHILYSGNILLKQTFYSNVQNTVIPLLYHLYMGSAEQNFYVDNNVCRLELLRVLQALQMNPHVTLAFPIQYCLEISHMAAHDIDSAIMVKAIQITTELEKIIHPVAPTLQLPRQQEPDTENEPAPENQVNREEIAATSKVNKRSKDEEKLEDVLVHKRPKIISCEVIRNKIDLELIKKDNSMNINTSQTDEKSCKEIEKKETENVLQEQDKIQIKEQSQLDVDIIPNVATESEMECELAASPNVNTEQQKQHEKPEDFESCTDEQDKKVEKNHEINDEIQKSQDDSHISWETLDDDVIESLHLFHDEVKSKD